jgi:hypothetical protein
LTLLPLHFEFLGHCEQEVRVLSVLPSVKEPAGHTLQVLAPVALYLLSEPHGTQVLQIQVRELLHVPGASLLLLK